MRVAGRARRQPSRVTADKGRHMPILPARRRLLLWIVVVGGVTVLASYVIGFITSPGLGAALWRGIPPWLRLLYESSMLLAAAGFFPFTSFSLDPPCRA